MGRGRRKVKERKGKKKKVRCRKKKEWRLWENTRWINGRKAREKKIVLKIKRKEEKASINR